MKDKFFLLSGNEYQENKDNISEIDGSWWLRSPDNTDNSNDSVITVAYTDYDSDYVNSDRNSVRPACYVEPTALEKLQRTESGNVMFGGVEWNVANEETGLLVTAHLVAERSFNQAVNNDYEASDIRQWINEEFEKNFSKEELDKVLLTDLEKEREGKVYTVKYDTGIDYEQIYYENERDRLIHPELYYDEPIEPLNPKDPKIMDLIEPFVPGDSEMDGKVKDYVQIYAPSMGDALEKAAGEISFKTGQDYPIDYEAMIKDVFASPLAYAPEDVTDIFNYLKKAEMQKENNSLDAATQHEYLSKLEKEGYHIIDGDISIPMPDELHSEHFPLDIGIIFEDREGVEHTFSLHHLSDWNEIIEFVNKGLEVDGHSCRKIDEWQTDMANYVLGQDVKDNDFYYVEVFDVTDGLKGTYTYEFDRMPTKQEVEDNHLNRISEIALDQYESEYGADGSRVFPDLNAPGPIDTRKEDFDKLHNIIHSALEAFQNKYPMEEYEYPTLITDLVTDFENCAAQMITDCLTESGDTDLEDMLIEMHDLTALDAVRDIKGEYFPTKLLKQEYDPLRKVEELEEGNYNMIDGITNNGFGEKQQKKTERNKEAASEGKTKPVITADELKTSNAAKVAKEASEPQREQQKKNMGQER